MRKSLIFHWKRGGWKRKIKRNIIGRIIFPSFNKDPCSALEESTTHSLSLIRNLGSRSDLSEQNCSSLVTFFFN